GATAPRPHAADRRAPIARGAAQPEPALHRLLRARPRDRRRAPLPSRLAFAARIVERRLPRAGRAPLEPPGAAARRPGARPRGPDPRLRTVLAPTGRERPLPRRRPGLVRVRARSVLRLRRRARPIPPGGRGLIHHG